jgi:hypothetical protein
MSTRAVEVSARSVISTELGVAVEIHDGGGGASMCDLRIGSRDGAHVAIQCVGAIDPVPTETWHVGATRGGRAASLSGDWTVEIRSGAPFRRIMRELGPLLHFLERETVDDVRVDRWLRQRDQLLHDQFDGLDVIYAHRHRQHGTAKVSFTMLRPGGAVGHSGASVPGWVSGVLTHVARADVVSKLARSGAPGPRSSSP